MNVWPSDAWLGSLIDAHLPQARIMPSSSAVAALDDALAALARLKIDTITPKVSATPQRLM
jgi:hypothetical protein